MKKLKNDNRRCNVAEFTGVVERIVIVLGEKSKTPKYCLLVKDNDKNGFGEISVVINICLVRGVLVRTETNNLPIAVKVTAPNIKKNGVVRLDDQETTLTFL